MWVVFLSIIVTWIVSLVAIPVSMVLCMILLFFLSYLPGGVFLLQAITYAIADIAGLIVGSLVLQVLGDFDYYLWLLIVPAVNTIRYIFSTFSFNTFEAQQKNRYQKSMSIIGSITAIVLGYLYIPTILG